MSISNLSNAANQQDITISCDTLTCTNLIASFSTLPVIETTNLVVETLQIQPNPPTDNTQNNLLAIDSIGAVIIRQASSISGSGDITGASSLGSGSPIYQSQTGFILNFNSLTGTSGDISVSSPISGNINLDVGSNIVTLSGTQTLVNKTLTIPIISSISNTGTLTLPTTTGTLALTSQIPVVTNTSVTGDIASFSNNTGAIVDSGIQYSNVVTLTGTQTLTNKTLTSPIISSISNGGTITIPTGTFTLATTSNLSNYVDLTSNQTISGQKTFSNSILISSGTSSITYGSTGIIFTQGSNNLTLQEGAFTGNYSVYLPFSTGTLALTSQLPTITGTSVNGDIAYFTNTTGAIGDSGILYTSLVTLTGTQTLSNKTLSLLESQGTGETRLNGKVAVNYYNQVSSSATAIAVSTIAVPTGTCFMVDVQSNCYCTASTGSDLNKVKFVQDSFGAKNVSGTITTYTISTSSTGDATFAPSCTLTSSGTNVIFNIVGISGDTITFGGTITITYE
jgi:hypothetical protein